MQLMPGEFFEMPSAMFQMDLTTDEMATYAYLRCRKNNRTYKCWPSYKTIGEAIGRSRKSVAKYVSSLEEKGLISTEPTEMITKKGVPLNGKGMRTILLPTSTLEVLKERRKSAVTDWIFPSPRDPEKPVAPSSAYHRLKVILKDAGLPDIRFHDLRHTFATHALTSGVDAKTLSGILGHTNASFTLDTYTHVTMGMQENAAEIVGGFIDELFGEELKPWQSAEKPARAR